VKNKMLLDKREFEFRCKEVIEDVHNEKITSPTWGWMALGAMTGFVCSCLHLKRKEARPIIGSYRKMTGEIKNG